MNSFSLIAIGNLSRDPERIVREHSTCARFCLIGNDYAGRDESDGERQIVTSIWFVAFGSIAEAIVRNTRKGDQLIVEAQVRAGNRMNVNGQRRYEYSYVVQGFRFGAPGKLKRAQIGSRACATASTQSDR